MKNYTRGSHTVYHHRYHLVWITKYRYRVLSVQIRARELLARISEEMGVKIIKGVLSKGHIHVFCSISPHVSVSDYTKKLKGKSSYKLQKELDTIFRSLIKQLKTAINKVEKKTSSVVKSNEAINKKYKIALSVKGAGRASSC